MRHRAPLLAVSLALLAVSPAWAIKEWYDHYLGARDEHMRDGRYSEAIRSLKEAIRLKPTPALNERTYGLQFVDYLPYYHLGICYLKTNDFNTAIRMFNIEEDKGAIKRSGLYRGLLRLRTEAENGERQRVARLAREEVDRLLKEASDLQRTRKFDEALTRLAQAQAAAKNLDPQTQRTILDMIARVRADEKELAEAHARAQRVEQALAEGRRLLEEGKATEAVVRFDEVLRLDPRSARALDGRREAQERILASTTRQARQAAFLEGKALFEAGQYLEAVHPLTDAAADAANAEAHEYLEKARGIIEGLRQQKELRRQIEGLLAEGERLTKEHKFPEAWVKFDRLLQLDPGNVRAQERRNYAQTMTGERLMESWMPNRPPVLTFFEPRALETTIEGDAVAIVGVASDDRGIARIEFRGGDRVLARQSPPRRPDLGESLQNVRFERKIPLEPGPNEVVVTATDTGGLRQAETFHVTRRLRFWETRAFLPSALGAAVGIVGLGFGVQQARRRRAVRRRFNPYIAGAPVMDDEMFFGRQRFMDRMLNVLHHNSLMITGERRIGKTTFLYHLRKALVADDGTEYRFFPVLTDLQGVPEEGFFHTVMSDVVETLKLSSATLSCLRFRAGQDRYDGRDFSHDLQRVVEELAARTPKKVKLALLIDEVDVLNEYSERINQRLRSIFMKTFSEHLVAIMSGVGIKRIWKSEGSPWYNFFDEVELQAFSREEAEALIRTPVEGIFRFEAKAVEGILAYSQLKPYLIQKFCIHAVNRILEEGRTTITARDVEAVRGAVQLEGRDGDAPRAPLDQQASA